MHGWEVSIVTADGSEAPAGTEGEVRVRGPMLFAGYTDPQQAMVLSTLSPHEWKPPLR